MSEPETKPSTSRVQLQPSNPEKTLTCFSPNLAKRMQDDTCYLCHQKGHWSWFCPLKSKSRISKTLFSPSPTRNDSPVSPNSIRCRCGHGFCEIRTSRSEKNPNRKYFACPIKRGARCREFVKWCDDGIDESDLQPPPFKFPECECGAGVCRRVKQQQNTDAVKYYFVCPVKQDHGACGYRVSEEDLLNSGNGSIVPIRQSRQRTLHEFFGRDQNEKTDGDLGEGDYLLVHSERTRIMDSSENPLSVAVSEIPEEEDAGALVRVPASEHVGFPEFEVADEDLEFANSVSWETIEAEAFSLSRLSTARIQWQQSSWPMDWGWLGRLLFFYPTQSLKFPTPQPFFRCIFPSFNPIVAPKQTNIPDRSYERNQLAITVSQHAQLSTGCHTEVSRVVVTPDKSQDGERKSIVSKAQRHREVVLFTQKRLLTDLEALDPCEHESMREAAENTFALLNVLGVDYKQFSDHVLYYISFVSSIAEIDRSTENSLTMEEHNRLFEEEKMRFAQLQDDYDKTKALLDASNHHKLLLYEQVSNLKAMLREKQEQLKSCELETLKIETQLGDLKRSMLEADITFKERGEQTEIARKQSEERQAKQIAANAALEKAKHITEN